MPDSSFEDHEIVKLTKKGFSLRQISKVIGLTAPTIYQRLKKLEIPEDDSLFIDFAKKFNFPPANYELNEKSLSYWYFIRFFRTLLLKKTRLLLVFHL